MAKASNLSDAQNLRHFLQSFQSDTVPYRQFFELLVKAVGHTEGLIITSLPRGSLQIAQPARVSEQLTKRYSKEFQVADRPAWQAILSGQAVRGSDCWTADDWQSNLYASEFLRPKGYEHVVAVPLRAPVLEGYPGVLYLMRTAEQGNFSDEELRQLSDLAKLLDAACERGRQARQPRQCERPMGFSHRPQLRKFVFGPKLRAHHAGPVDLDDQIEAQLRQHANRLHEANGEAVEGERLQLPDTHGDLWTFRAVKYPRLPALGHGPVVVFCLQPEWCDWVAVRPTDFQADNELSRLIPAMQFMAQKFNRGPTLGEIAKHVHLSPFHFHRRFTELLGLTPKHFLLECQIFEAKYQLLARQKDLAQIAKDCGFAHQSHFTSRFKQATGLTPTRWRRVFMQEKSVSSN